MLDVGTVKHDAVLVKTKKWSYIAPTFFRRSRGHLWRDGKITTDQGDEFERTINLYMEQMSKRWLMI